MNKWKGKSIVEYIMKKENWFTQRTSGKEEGKYIVKNVKF